MRVVVVELRALVRLERVLDRELVQAELLGELVDLVAVGPQRSTQTMMSGSARCSDTSASGKSSASSTPLRQARVRASPIDISGGIHRSPSSQVPRVDWRTAVRCTSPRSGGPGLRERLLFSRLDM